MSVRYDIEPKYENIGIFLNTPFRLWYIHLSLNIPFITTYFTHFLENSCNLIIKTIKLENKNPP